MSFVQSKRNSGYAPLQDHGTHKKGYALWSRASIWAKRIVDIRDETNRLGQWVYDEQTVGDIIGGMFYNREIGKRDTGAWSYAFPGIITGGGSTPLILLQDGERSEITRDLPLMK